MHKRKMYCVYYIGLLHALTTYIINTNYCKFSVLKTRKLHKLDCILVTLHCDIYFLRICYFLQLLAMCVRFWYMVKVFSFVRCLCVLLFMAFLPGTGTTFRPTDRPTTRGPPQSTTGPHHTTSLEQRKSNNYLRRIL